MENVPFVSVVLPCRNEEKYIKNCLLSLIHQDLGKDNYEIILVDGLSEDKTLTITKETTKEFENIRIFTNHKKVTPYAMSIGAQNAKGDIIVMVLGHAIFPHDFLSNGLRLFEKFPDASCVGGPITSVGENAFATAIALAMSSKIGIGNANHRFPGYEGPAEMACFPFYKKEVFEQLGYYDERFIRNQDDEFAFRVTKSGRKIYISPTVQSKYIVRNTPKKLFKQYYGYGYFKWLGYKKHKKFISVRHIIPSVFLLFNLLNIIFSFIFSNIFIFLLPFFSYLLIIFIFSIRHIKKGIKTVFAFSLAVIILHFSYGYGFIKSLLTNKNNF
ncbi:MAG: glycosyltransferase family 2 protein [bacterium]